MFDLAIKNGMVVKSDQMILADVYIQDGKIRAICDHGSHMEAKEVKDASGMLLFPGAVDAHMHVGEYQADFEEMDTSTAAAAVGGVTCVIDMPLNLKSSSVLDGRIFQEKKAHLEEKSYTDFLMWGALVPENIDKLEEMHNLGAASFKSFLSGAGSDFTAPNMAQVRRALMTIKAFGGMAGFHCEDYNIIKEEQERVVSKKVNTRQAFLDSRPLSAELIATSNILILAKETGTKVHICHVSHPAVAQLIKEAKADGVDVSAETCVHYLTLNEEDFLREGCLLKCAPPLREKEAMENLWSYVEDGTLSCVASDHSPGMLWDRDDTNRPVYEVGNGISGVQTMFQTYYDAAMKRGLSASLLAKTLSENPARRWNIFGKKGAIEVGFDADIVLLDPKKEWTVTNEKLLYKQKISGFVGRTGTGCPVETYIRGVLVAKDGKMCVEAGFGEAVQ